MKKIVKTLLAIILGVVLISCGASEPVDLWESATYTENQEFGTGDKTITVDVIAEEKSLEFTVHTDKEILGDALLEHELISGDEGAYGLYVKTVNGIYADYNITKSYWGINKNGESLMTGVDSAEITDGDTFEFVYTKN
jgi:hypothetical protein